MRTIWSVLLASAFLASSVYCSDLEESAALDDQAEGRILFNTSSTANTLTLLGAAILIGVIAYLIFAGGILGPNSYNRNSYQYDESAYYDPQYSQYRSSSDGYDFNSLNVLNWIAMLQDVYENFDYNDLECQKRLICEVMKEPEYYGTAAAKFKAGFQYAKYLEVLNLPDDMRELLDEYLDANSRSDQNKGCDEYFQCPYSIKESVKRTISSNSL